MAASTSRQIMTILLAATLLAHRSATAAGAGGRRSAAFVGLRRANRQFSSVLSGDERVRNEDHDVYGRQWHPAKAAFYSAVPIIPSYATLRSVRVMSTVAPATDNSLVGPSYATLRSVRVMPTVAPATDNSLVGIDYVRSSVVEVLNELFDPVEIARASAVAKLDSKKKKKKKKKQATDQAVPAEEEEPKGVSEEERAAIIARAAANARPFSAADSMVTPATKPEFGDYQCNAAMSLARPLGMNPRECAQRIADALGSKLGGAVDELEIAGPGFINVKLSEAYLKGRVGYVSRDCEEEGRLGIPLTDHRQKIVVDFSSPNIAKEMHVGHLRSTIIGDTLANLLSFAGHDVLRLNHVGDWGIQSGMLVEHLRDEFPEALSKETSQNVDLGDLVTLYKAARQRFYLDEKFRTRSWEGVVKLQAGDDEALAAWESLCAASRVEYQKIYDMLNICGLEERGESFYNPYLNAVIEDLETMGLAVQSKGATVVFLDGYTNPYGSALVVRKSDGGFNYATKDLAAIRQRVQMDSNEGGESADRVLYVTDAGQSQHFEMVFAAATKAQFVGDASLEHVPFGFVLGEDGQMIPSRSRDTVRVKDLLDEAVRIAREDMKSRMDNPGEELSEALADVAKTVGIGALKYADLSMNRESNYKFSYGRMLSLNGNTAPYMLYAYARICSIVRKATGQSDDGKVVWPEAAEEILIAHDSEKQLIRNLVKLPDILSEVESELYPNRLCDYLFETSQKFNQFYENCSVNNAETPELKASRLSLCTVSAATIRLLMSLLGIPVVEKL